MRKLGVIGSGVVGRTLAGGFKKRRRAPPHRPTPRRPVAARAIEPLAQLWCIPGLRQNSWTHAFEVLWK